MNKVLMKGAISLFLVAVLLLSMTTIAAAIDEEGWGLLEEQGFEHTTIVWDLDSEITGYVTTTWQMEKLGGPGDDGQSGSVTIEQDKSAVWIADEAAQVSLTFPTTLWAGILGSSGTGNCRVWVGKWNGVFSPSHPNEYEDVALSSLSVWKIDVSALTILKDEHLAFKVENTGDSGLTIVTDGTSGVMYPGDKPAYPLPELPTAILLGIGLLGLVGYLGVRRHKVLS